MKQKKQHFNYNKKKKELVLVFDENARKEFLTGFRKRKLQRKNKAAEELKQKLKLEKKKIHEQTKLMYKKIMRSQMPAHEITHLLSEEIDMGEHSVSVTEVSSELAAKAQNWIGQNQVCYEHYEHNGKEPEINNLDEVVEGMEINSKSKKITETNYLKIKTEKDFKKAVKKEATQHVKKSKIFKIKSKKDQVKNAKLKKREERKRAKANRKKGIKVKRKQLGKKNKNK